MAITTLAKVKTVLGISGTTQDALITELIARVEEDYKVIRNRDWDTEVEDERVGVGDGSTLEFTLAKHPVIYDSEYIYVGGSLSKDYSLNLTTGVITFTTAPDAGKRVTADYEAVNTYYPDGAELTAIRMVGYLIETQKAQGIQSESLGDHSITFDKSDFILGYPKSIVGNIRRHTSFV